MLYSMSKTEIELQRLRDELQIAELKTRCIAIDGLGAVMERASAEIAATVAEEAYESVFETRPARLAKDVLIDASTALSRLS